MGEGVFQLFSLHGLKQTNVVKEKGVGINVSLSKSACNGKIGATPGKESVQSFPQSGVDVIPLVYGPEGPEETPDYKAKRAPYKTDRGKTPSSGWLYLGGS